MFALSVFYIGGVCIMNEKREKILDMIENGLRMIQSSHSAVVISEQEEADANNIEDYMHSYVFLNGKPTDLCVIKANSKMGCVEVFDTVTHKNKREFEIVKILRWDLIQQKGDISALK